MCFAQTRFIYCIIFAVYIFFSVYIRIIFMWGEYFIIGFYVASPYIFLWVFKKMNNKECTISLTSIVCQVICWVRNFADADTVWTWRVGRLVPTPWTRSSAVLCGLFFGPKMIWNVEILFKLLRVYNWKKLNAKAQIESLYLQYDFNQSLPIYVIHNFTIFLEHFRNVFWTFVRGSEMFIRDIFW